MALGVTITNEASNPRAGLVGVGFVEAMRQVFTDQEAERKEIERLRSRHADYVENEEHWKFLLLAYEGGPQYISQNTLFKHQREHQDDYVDRLSRASYQNYTAPIVDFVPELIFKDPIDRDPNPEIKAQFDKFVKDVDRMGTDMSVFMRSVAEESRLFGHVYVQVDKVSVSEEEGEISVQRASELGVDIPYLLIVKPLEVLDWVADNFGGLVYVKRVEYLTMLSPKGETMTVERYSEWTNETVKVMVIDVTEANKPALVAAASSVKPNPWHTVPFVKVVSKRSKANRDLGVSAVTDIAYQNRRAFNLTSLLDEFLYKQCFNMLAMETDTALPTRDSVEGDLGTSNILQVPRQASHMPQYVSPPVDPAQFIQTERADTIREMYRQASQDVASEIFAVSNRSGDAAKQAFGRTVPAIARLADVLQESESRILQMWARLMGLTWKGKVAYRDDYSITSLQDLLLQLSTIFNNLKIVVPSFVREEWKRIIREFDGRIAQDVRERIWKEIDDMPDEDIEEMYLGSDEPSVEGLPTTKNLLQGDTQERLGSDGKISMASGSKSATKEAVPDANKRATGASR